MMAKNNVVKIKNKKFGVDGQRMNEKNGKNGREWWSKNKWGKTKKEKNVGNDGQRIKEGKQKENYR